MEGGWGGGDVRGGGREVIISLFDGVLDMI